MEKDRDKKPRPSAVQAAPVNDMEELYRRLSPVTNPPRPDAIAAALEAAQRLAAEADAEDAATDVAHDLATPSSAAASVAAVCPACGYRNRGGNKFCGMCGSTVEAADAESTSSREARFASEESSSRAMAIPPQHFLEPEREPMANRGRANETHHYHHHYHHHYFPGGQEGTPSQNLSGRPVDVMRESEKQRPTAALRGDMSRAEAAVRRITQEWVLACNTKHLDDLLDLYVADALVLRSNYPPVRGAAAVREFFFGALDAGLGEVEVEPLRVEIVGDLAYEAGRCKALVPGATGKRREERGKYLWVCARQSNGEWKLAADCWSSDLSFTTLESDVPPSAGVKSGQPRKSS